MIQRTRRPLGAAMPGKGVQRQGDLYPAVRVGQAGAGACGGPKTRAAERHPRAGSSCRGAPQALGLYMGRLPAIKGRPLESRRGLLQNTQVRARCRPAARSLWQGGGQRIGCWVNVVLGLQASAHAATASGRACQ